MEKLDLDAADLKAQLEILKQRARLALNESLLEPGNPVNLDFARKRARATHRRKGRLTEERIRPILKKLRADGINTYRALAAALNKMEIRPPQAQLWSGSSIRNIEIRHPEE